MPAADEAHDKSAAGHSSVCLAHHASVLVAALVESMAASLVLGTGWCEGAEGAGSGGVETPH